MGQYWKLVNVDRGCSLENNDGGLKLWEILVNRPAEQLLDLLGLQTAGWNGGFKVSDDAIVRAKVKCSASALVALPQELIDTVVPYVEPIEQWDHGADIVSLGLTCSYFLRLLAPSIRRLLEEDAAPWAGDRLIFVGDYAEGFPTTMSHSESKEIIKVLRQRMIADGLFIEGEDDESRITCNPLYTWGKDRSMSGERVGTSLRHSLRRRVEPRVVDSLFELGRGSFSAPGGQQTDSEDIRLFDRVCTTLTLETRFEVAPQCCVLRNLNTKEYVRDDAIAASEYAYSLGEVVISYTLFTHDPSGTEGLGIERRWAGARFDIVRADKVCHEDCWMDVSKEAIESLKAGTGMTRNNGRRAHIKV